MPAADVPHLAWPFRMAGARLATVEQDSIEDVQQNVRSYLHTTRGERSLSPGFGIDDPTFGPGLNTALLEAEIEDAEAGRAHVEIAAEPIDGAGRMAIDVHVRLAE